MLYDRRIKNTKSKYNLIKSIVNIKYTQIL